MVDSTNPRVIADNIKELAANGGTTVEANPEGAATADLEKLGVDGTVYGIPSIEANPEGEATDNLEKLGVGGAVYEIPSGGGGFIDPSTIIKAKSLISNNTATYTATKDCFVVFKLLASSNDIAYVKIGNVVMWYSNAASSQLFNGGSLLVKAGQTVTLYQSSAMVDGEYTVYDLL